MKFGNLVTTTPVWLLLFFTTLLMAPPTSADSGPSILNKDSDNVAIEGYDAVAYFTEQKAVKGNPEFVFDWHEARWQFSSAQHRDLFAADPERYAPQFGGFCAGAMTRGLVIKADPEAWTIVDGRLYIKVNKEFRDEWREDTAGNIEKAREAWAAMIQK